MNQPWKPLYLFDDQPVMDVDADHLAIQTYATVIAAAALGAEGPFNIGVFAGWGHGKTSVLRLAQSLIEKNKKKPEAITVWVNAWKYEHEEHPIVPLVACIVNEVDSQLYKWKQENYPVSDATKKFFMKASRGLRAIAYGFSAKSKLSMPGFGEIEAGFIAEKMIDRYEELSGIPQDPLLDRSLYYRADELLRNLPKSETNDLSPKIVVFIDDLDRCLPPKALSLLEGIKLMLAHRGFIFVLAVDRRIIDSFLEERYRAEYGLKDYAKDGARYMDKLIQLPLYLPSHENKFEEYIDKLIDRSTSNLEDEIKCVFRELKVPLAAGANRNPRTLIRTLNRLLVDRFLWSLRINQNQATVTLNEDHFLRYATVARILEGKRPM